MEPLFQNFASTPPIGIGKGGGGGGGRNAPPPPPPTPHKHTHFMDRIVQNYIAGNMFYAAVIDEFLVCAHERRGMALIPLRLLNGEGEIPNAAWAVCWLSVHSILNLYSLIAPMDIIIMDSYFKKMEWLYL